MTSLRIVLLIPKDGLSIQKTIYSYFLWFSSGEIPPLEKANIMLKNFFFEKWKKRRKQEPLSGFFHEFRRKDLFQYKNWCDIFGWVFNCRYLTFSPTVPKKEYVRKNIFVPKINLIPVTSEYFNIRIEFHSNRTRSRDFILKKFLFRSSFY